MARLTENDVSNKGKAGMNGVKQVLNDVPGIDDINENVRKVKDDASQLAETVRDAASGTIRRGQDYVQSGIETVKDAGSQVADKVTSMQDMPLRKAVYGIAALCLLSFFLGRRS